MNLFAALEQAGHEQVCVFQHPDSGLKCLLAIHDSSLGPALGALRMWPYANEADALRHVLGHSAEMTYKAALAGLNLGGGKGVIIGDPESGRNEALLRSLGRYIDSLGGRYIACEDIGTTAQDMELIRLETRHVIGVPTHSGGSGDPSRF